MAKNSDGPTPPSGKKRGPGRPSFGDRVATPENLELIRRMWLEGRSTYQIGKAIGCEAPTIVYHIQHSVLPKQRTVWEGRIEEIVLKVEHLYAVSWEQFQRSKKPQTMEQLRKKLSEKKADGDLVERVTRATTRTGEACWLDLVRWCLDWFSKVSGIYAAEKIELQEGLRVAGKSRAEIDEEVLRYLADRVAERKVHEAAVEQMYGSQGAIK